MRLWHSLFLGGLLGISGPVVAQPSDSALDNAPIVVTGARPTKEQLRERAAGYIRRVGVAWGHQPLARWIDPVCPQANGIAEPYAAIVEAEIRAIADMAGIRTAEEGCAANISVSFVGNAEALMDVVHRRSPARFREVGPEARETLFTGNAPIRWWYQTDERTMHGVGRTPQSIPIDGGLPWQFDAYAQISSSIVSTQMKRAILRAEVVIDLDRVEGRQLGTVAAYAAFVALAEVQASAPPPPGSILELFHPEAEVRGLTEQDSTFLQALYRVPLDRPAQRNLGLLARGMTDIQSPD